MSTTESLRWFIETRSVDDAPILATLRDLLLRSDDQGRIRMGGTPLGENSAADIRTLIALGVLIPDTMSGSGTQEDPRFRRDQDGVAIIRFSDTAWADVAASDHPHHERLSLAESIDHRLEGLFESHFDEGSANPLARTEGAHEVYADASSELAQPARGDAALATLVPDQHQVPGRTVAGIDGATTLSARGLVKVYKKRRVVDEVDITLSQGEIVGLLGPNGAGKTTTFYMVVGLIQPDRGKVFFGEKEVTGVPMYRRARRGIGYLAQEPSIFRKLSVEENILAVLQMMRLPRRVQRERLEMLLDELGIKHLRHTKAYALSGGERRRLEITRALVGNPKFMLLDEPFAGVDPIAVHDIQQIVADLRRREIGVLISDHNVEQTLDIVDRAYIMYEGRVRVSGTVAELVWNDEVAEIYLGPTLTARMRQRYAQPH